MVRNVLIHLSCVRYTLQERLLQGQIQAFSPLKKKILFFFSFQIIFEISLLQAVLLTQYVCVWGGGGGWGGLSLAGAAPSIIFVTTKPCHDKHVFVMTTHVICHNKSILVTVNFGRDRHISVMTNLCDDKMYDDKNDTYGSSHQRQGSCLATLTHWAAPELCIAFGVH